MTWHLWDGLFCCIWSKFQVSTSWFRYHTVMHSYWQAERNEMKPTTLLKNFTLRNTYCKYIVHNLQYIGKNMHVWLLASWVALVETELLPLLCQPRGYPLSNIRAWKVLWNKGSETERTWHETFCNMWQVWNKLNQKPEGKRSEIQPVQEKYMCFTCALKS